MYIIVIHTLINKQNAFLKPVEQYVAYVLIAKRDKLSEIIREINMLHLEHMYECKSYPAVSKI